MYKIQLNPIFLKIKKINNIFLLLIYMFFFKINIIKFN